MKNAEMNKKLHNAMQDFEIAYSHLKAAIDEYEQTTGASINDLKGFTDSYPFDTSLDDLDISRWVTDVTDSLRSVRFKVLRYQYMNTGGSCMVGIHDVWFPDEKRIMYVFTNEEGCTLSTVDYISNDLETEDFIFDDYDEVTVDCVDFGRITGYEKYFELYRHCYNQYLVDDCKYFGTSYGVQYHLLSDELQKKIDDDYLVWLESERDGLVRTDGQKIIVDPDYTEYLDDAGLQSLMMWKDWHNDLINKDTTDEEKQELYDKDYTLTFNGVSVTFSFDADTFSTINNLLTRLIEQY